MLCIDRVTGRVKYAHIYDINDSNLSTKPIYVNQRHTLGPTNEVVEHIITRTLKHFKEDLRALSKEEVVTLYTINSPFQFMSSAFDPPEHHGDFVKENIIEKKVNWLEEAGVRCEDNEAFQQLSEILMSTFPAMTKDTLQKMYEYNSYLFIGIPEHRFMHWHTWSVEQPLQCDVKFSLSSAGFTRVQASDGVEQGFDLKGEGLVSTQSVKSTNEGYRPYDEGSIASRLEQEEASGMDGSLPLDGKGVQSPASGHSWTSSSSVKCDKIDNSGTTLFQRFSHYWCGPSKVSPSPLLPPPP